MVKVVLYTSKSKIEDVNLNYLIEKARIKNKRLGITGFLVCHLNGFIQLLEGDEKAIDDLVAEIKADERHSDFTIKATCTMQRRLFPDWDMGLMKVTDATYYDVVDKKKNLIEIFSERVRSELAVRE